MHRQKHVRVHGVPLWSYLIGCHLSLAHAGRSVFGKCFARTHYTKNDTVRMWVVLFLIDADSECIFV